MKTIPLAAAERIMKKAGAKRISDKAKKTLVELLEEIGIQISERALMLANHAKRKTVKEEDIKLSKKDIW